MTLPMCVADLLDERVTLEVECIDRMYLNLYQPRLQHELGLVGFFREHLGYPFVSSALMDPISKRFVADIHGFIAREGVDLVSFRPGQRKDDIAHEYLARFDGEEGSLFVGRAHEKTPVFRTEKRRNPATGATFPWLVRSTSMVNHFYFYGVDTDFGPFFIKLGTYFPYTGKVCINGNEWAKRQAAKGRHRLRAARQRLRLLRGPQTAAEDLRPSRRHPHRQVRPQVAGPAPPPVHRRRPQSRLPLRRVDPAGRVLPHPGPGPARVRADLLRGSDPRQPRPGPPTGSRSSSTGGSGPGTSTRPPSRWRTRVFTQGVTPSLHVEYKRTRVKQYHKEGVALRTETTINDPRDHRQTAAQPPRPTGDRLLRQPAPPRPTRARPVPRHHRLPTPARRLHQPRPASPPRPAARRSRPHPHRRTDDLRPPTPPSSPAHPRIDGTHRYRPTDLGLRVAVFYTRAYDHFIRTGLTEITADQPTRLAQAFTRLDKEMDRLAHRAQLAE